jgi:hypothetical protein
MTSPTPAEVKQQLKTIERSGDFSGQQIEYLYLISERPGRSALQLSHELQTQEGQVRKVAAMAREKLPLYYATKGLSDTIYLDHSHRGYTLEPRRINPIAKLTPEDQERFNHGTNLREMLAASTLKPALVIFEELRQRYPNFAPLCVGLADVHCLLAVHCIVSSPDAYSRAERYALQAIALDQTLWTAHAALCMVRCSQWRWSDAKAALDRAEALNPVAA